MKKKIISTAKKIHKKCWGEKGDVSQKTRSAQKVTRKWQDEVCKKYPALKKEQEVSPKNNERIDIVDYSDKTAYELKVSGKNPHHEFYGDIAKVLSHNENYSDKKLKTLVFITEKKGIASLKARLDPKYRQLLKQKHNLDIKLEAL